MERFLFKPCLRGQPDGKVIKAGAAPCCCRAHGHAVGAPLGRGVVGSERQILKLRFWRRHGSAGDSCHDMQACKRAGQSQVGGRLTAHQSYAAGGAGLPNSVLHAVLACLQLSMDNSCLTHPANQASQAAQRKALIQRGQRPTVRGLDATGYTLPAGSTTPLWGCTRVCAGRKLMRTHP